MFWPFKRKDRAARPTSPAAPDPDIYDQAAQNLIAQGVDPAKVHRATRLVKRYARQGVLPDGLARSGEDQAE